MSEIALRVGGRELRNWTQWDVESDLLTPADAFSLSVGTAEGGELQWIAPGQLVTLALEGDPVLVGLIDEVTLNYDSGDRSLTVTGRDLAATLVDCNLPAWNLYDTTLKEAAEKVLSYLKVSASVIAEGGALIKGTLRVEPEETAWQFLERYAKKRECLLWFAPDGLHIAPPDYNQDEGWTLVQGQGGNIKGGQITWGIAERFSEVTVRGQASDGTVIEAKREDEDLPIFRPKRFTDHGATSWTLADNRARWELERRRVDGLELRYTVAGHRTQDALWWPGFAAFVLDPLAGLAESLFITKVRRSLSIDGGSETALTLSRKGALLGFPDPPGAGGLF